jgi:hypothetical protein
MRSTVDIILKDCDPTSLPWLDWLSKSGHYISGKELAGAIEAGAVRNAVGIWWRDLR